MKWMQFKAFRVEQTSELGDLQTPTIFHQTDQSECVDVSAALKVWKRDLEWAERQSHSWNDKFPTIRSRRFRSEQLPTRLHMRIHGKVSFVLSSPSTTRPEWSIQCSRSIIQQTCNKASPVRFGTCFIGNLNNCFTPGQSDFSWISNTLCSNAQSYL